MRNLPSLGALKAFEAGARHLSFTRAADELCVTQTAISHQIRGLENHLGVKLFARDGQNIRLTSSGKEYFTEVQDIITRLESATARITSTQNKTVRITALPSFVSCWLLPKLKLFRQAHPDISIEINSTSQNWDFAEDRFDLAIRSGLGRWSGLDADLIAEEHLSPVCTPHYIAQHGSIEVAEDLLICPLLNDTPKDAWQRWFRFAGVINNTPQTSLQFDDHAHMIDAVLDGHGIGLGKLTLVEDHIQSGRLVRPVDTIMPNDFSYWLVYSPSKIEREEVGLFRDWVLKISASQSGNSLDHQVSNSDGSKV